MERSRIALLGPAWPYRGGPALFMTFLHEVLGKDFEVHFVNFRMMYPRLLFPGTTPLDLSKEHHRAVPGPRLLHSLNPYYWWLTARHLHRIQPDLIVFDWYQPFFGPMYFGIGLMLPRSLRRRIVFITENVISHEARSVDRLLTRLGLHWSKAFVALSAKVERDLAPFARNAPIHRSELPVFTGFRQEEGLTQDICRSKLNVPLQGRMLLFFGYIRHYKGLDLLIQALALLNKEEEHFLLVAGECYENPALYTDIIDRSGLKDKVIFRNAYIPNEEVALWFGASDAVVLPYRSATQSGILQMANGFGVPAVVTNVGGLSEFLEDGKTGILVPEASSEAIAQGIRRFYAMRREIPFERNIREKASQNSFAGISRVFRQMLQDLGKVGQAPPTRSRTK